MDQYEKGVDKVVNALEGVGRGANRVYIGCATILANLFFAAFCAWGAYAGYISWQLQTNGETTTGAVVTLEEQSDAEGGCCTYVPILEYVVDGQTYSIKGGTASSPPQYEVGERVPIIYDPTNPNKAQINKGAERWLMPLILVPSMLIGALLINFFMLRAFRRGDSV